MHLNFTCRHSLTYTEGGSIWEAGVVMSMWLNAACKRSHMDGKLTPGVPQPFLRETQILELGTGTGLVGLAAAAAGGACVLTDLPDVLRVSTADNVERSRKLGTTKGIVLQVALRVSDGFVGCCCRCQRWLICRVNRIIS